MELVKPAAIIISGKVRSGSAGRSCRGGPGGADHCGSCNSGAADGVGADVISDTNKCSRRDCSNAQADNDSLVWSQNQQKILEWALNQFPKGTAERWDKIAEHIPGKTKVSFSV